MMQSPRFRREGFTLLEVLLASALAIVLMAALYVALDVQLRLAADGREAIEQATVTRALVQRFDNDVAGIIGPVAPPVGKAGSTTGSTGTTATGAATTDPAAGGAVMEAVTQSTTIQFQAGVIGESDGENRPRLTMFVAKVAGLARSADESGEMPNPADMRRVTYWMTDGGLARQELPWLTSDRLHTSTEPDIEDGKEERDYVIADEVIRLAFEYWDGSAWSETWDGRTLNSDGQTLKGPPVAIRVRFWINVPGPEPGEMVEKEFRHTIAVRSAPGPATAAADTTATTTTP
jgi:Tfp pilus assembly protein PilV